MFRAACRFGLFCPEGGSGPAPAGPLLLPSSFPGCPPLLLPLSIRCGSCPRGLCGAGAPHRGPPLRRARVLHRVSYVCWVPQSPHYHAIPSAPWGCRAGRATPPGGSCRPDGQKYVLDQARQGLSAQGPGGGQFTSGLPKSARPQSLSEGTGCSVLSLFGWAARIPQPPSWSTGSRAYRGLLSLLALLPFFHLTGFLRVLLEVGGGIARPHIATAWLQGMPGLGPLLRQP